MGVFQVNEHTKRHGSTCGDVSGHAIESVWGAGEI
jgi:hypothetical protein